MLGCPINNSFETYNSFIAYWQQRKYNSLSNIFLIHLTIYSIHQKLFSALFRTIHRILISHPAGFPSQGSSRNLTNGIAVGFIPNSHFALSPRWLIAAISRQYRSCVHLYRTGVLDGAIRVLAWGISPSRESPARVCVPPGRLTHDSCTRPCPRSAT